MPRPSTPRAFPRACLLLFLGCLPGCLGYRLTQDLPVGIRSLHVEVFTNATPYEEIEYELTRTLEQELRRRGARLAGTGAADATLSGRIVDYLPAAVASEEASGRVITRQVVVTADWSLARTGDDKPLAGQAGQKGSEAFFPSPSGGGEGAARSEAIRELAQAIVDRIYGSW